MSSVDVVIPCYNYARFLEQSVASVLEQPGVDVRVLVIDDCSSDDTPVVGAALAAADSRVEFRRHAVNQRHIATYNEGLIGWSTADYVVLLSADDMLAPGSLERAVRIMDADPKIGMVYGRPFYFTTEADLGKAPTTQRGWQRWDGAEWIAGRCKAGFNVISSPEVVVRGDVQRKVGGYNPDLPHLADLEMWLRIAAVSDVAYVQGVPQAFYRKHGNNMTKERTKLIDLFERRATFDTFFRDHAAPLAHANTLHNHAREALARQALWEACRAYDRNEVDEVGADVLVEFAKDTYANAEGLTEAKALRRRKLVGAFLCKYTQLFAPTAAYRRMMRWLAWRRWERQGV
jgi:glycosyltransferase involved in cell wall biosynthesis